MKKIFILFFGMLIINFSAFATVYNGTVVDGDTNELLPGANIYNNIDKQGTTTGLDGTFEFDCKNCTSNVVVVSFMGYKSQEITLVENEENTVKLEPNIASATQGDVIVGGDKSCQKYFEKHKEEVLQRYKRFEHAVLLEGNIDDDGNGNRGFNKNCLIKECEHGWRAFGNKCEEDYRREYVLPAIAPIKDDKNKDEGAIEDEPVKKNNNDFLIAVNKIDSWILGLKSNRSKWKDVSGNFNTARLASDLTAGVVLGTVGGVVSGVVIKKKQVEKGFESLGCYVAGQKMADWKDEFKVEFRRY